MMIRRERRLPAQWSNRWHVAGLLMLVFTGVALLGTEPLWAQRKAGRTKAKSSADASSDRPFDRRVDAYKGENLKPK